MSETGISAILLAILTLANLPICLYFARLVFGEQEDKDRGLIQWAVSFFQLAFFSPSGAGEWPAVKLIVFVAMYVLVIAAEYVALLRIVDLGA